ncbi:UNVERIFIED_CONTAM: protein TRACHEARY ELEMENT DIFFERENTIATION-RELATED 7A [Sesamum calycinum]|uniref:Protein TRACHEARY ELEMENT DIFFERENTIATION-RELATED 7A n=1 Tax=Sesamum calycinum TaxID=2727403 RepID=A0AAW2PA32_9LAMI
MNNGNGGVFSTATCTSTRILTWESSLGILARHYGLFPTFSHPTTSTACCSTTTTIPPSHPPPHVPPPPPPLSPDNGPTVIVIVFISFGSVFFVAFCLFALWCLIKKRKKKAVQETEIVRTDKHLRVKEAIVEGPHGPETVVLSIEEDKHTEEEIVKNEKVEGKDMVSKSGQTTVTDPVAGESSSKPRIHQTHHLLVHKN